MCIVLLKYMVFDKNIHFNIKNIYFGCLNVLDQYIYLFLLFYSTYLYDKENLYCSQR